MCVPTQLAPTRRASTHISGACKYKAVLDLITRRAQCSKSPRWSLHGAMGHGAWCPGERRTSCMKVWCVELSLSHTCAARAGAPLGRAVGAPLSWAVGLGGARQVPSRSRHRTQAHCTWDLGWTAGRDFGAAYNCYRLFLAFRPRVHFLCTATKGAATLGSGLGSGRQVGSSQRVSNQGSFNIDWTWREREFSGKCSPVCLLLPFLTCVGTRSAECSLLHSPSCNAGWVAPQLQHQLENRNNVEVSRRHALCRCTSHLALCT